MNHRPGNEGYFYWQSSAAGLILGSILGILTGIAIAVWFSLSVVPEYRSALMAVPLLGLLVGSLCGGLSGMVGTIYASRFGTNPPFILTLFSALLAAGFLSALGTGFEGRLWLSGVAYSVPAAVLLALGLPHLAERFRKPLR